jgi:hypothetical protein
MRILSAAIAISLFLLTYPVSAENAIVMYKGDDGWVRYNFPTSYYWDDFKGEFAEQGWNLEFRKHVDSSVLSNCDALFVINPGKNIPDDEANAIISWVNNGGKLVITQDKYGKYANEITENFGITFDSTAQFTVNKFISHPITDGLSVVGTFGTEEGRTVTVSGDAKELGFHNAANCLIAINENAGNGVVIAIGDEIMWKDGTFDKNSNEQFMDNILSYFSKPSEIPEFNPFTLLLAVTLLSGFVLYRSR